MVKHLGPFGIVIVGDRALNAGASIVNKDIDLAKPINQGFDGFLHLLLCWQRIPTPGRCRVALSGALHLIACLGGGTVEGYLDDATSVPAGFLYNGALSTYKQLGFTKGRMIGKHRWVVTTTVNRKCKHSYHRHTRFATTRSGACAAEQTNDQQPQKHP
jgi:hypothetical protein